MKPSLTSSLPPIESEKSLLLILGVSDLSLDMNTRLKHRSVTDFLPTHHKPGVGSHAVGDGLDPAVWEEDGVLALDGAPVTGLLLVEVVPDVVLDGVSVPERRKSITEIFLLVISRLRRQKCPV